MSEQELIMISDKIEKLKEVKILTNSFSKQLNAQKKTLQWFLEHTKQEKIFENQFASFHYISKSYTSFHDQVQLLIATADFLTIINSNSIDDIMGELESIKSNDDGIWKREQKNRKIERSVTRHKRAWKLN